MLKHGDAAQINHAFALKLGDWDHLSVKRRSRLSHIIRRAQKGGEKFYGFDFANLENLDLDAPLPSPSEQLDNLILWLGDNQLSTAHSVEVPTEELSAVLGLIIDKSSQGAGLGWLLSQGDTRRLIENQTAGQPRLHLRMLFEGWERYRDVKRGRIESRKAFMAMKFGEPLLDRAYKECFKPAVAQTGFELFDLRDQQ